VTPSYRHWIDDFTVNAVTSCRTQTYPERKLHVCNFDDGSKVWDMFQKALDSVRTEYYSIVGADDRIGADYISDCMDVLLKDSYMACATTEAVLIDRHDDIIGSDNHWVAGVFRTELARALGGYRAPSHKGDWGSAAELVVRASRAGFKCYRCASKEYYYRIWSGSVSKPDPGIDKKIAGRKSGQYFVLGDERSV